MKTQLSKPSRTKAKYRELQQEALELACEWPQRHSSRRSSEFGGSNQTNATILASNQRQTKSAIFKWDLAGDTLESSTGGG
jgi:hypothetical protein